MDAIAHIKYQCINLITPSLITSRSNLLISDESHIPQYMKDGLTLNNGYLYVYEDPAEDLCIFIEDAEHPGNRHNPEDEHRFVIYRVHPNLYQKWKKGENHDQTFPSEKPVTSLCCRIDRPSFHAVYTHQVYRIIEEPRMTEKADSDYWNDMVVVCKKVLKVDLEEMASAFAEANVFG